MNDVQAYNFKSKLSGMKKNFIMFDENYDENRCHLEYGLTKFQFEKLSSLCNDDFKLYALEILTENSYCTTSFLKTIFTPDVLFNPIASAIEYAMQYNIRLPWMEEDIASHRRFAFDYAVNVLKGRFLLGETMIATSTSKRSYLYALLIGERFILGEGKIKESDVLWNSYCRIFGEIV